MAEIKKTISSIFFVHPLKIGKEALLTNGFINAYISDIKREVQYENCIYLLFKPKNIDKFKDFLDNEYIRTTNIVEDYDYDGGFIVVVYELNKDFVELYSKDIQLIKQGKYSKTSRDFQSLYPRTATYYEGKKLIEEDSLQYRIFNQTPDLVKHWEERISYRFTPTMEVWSGWFDEKETLDIEKIKEMI